MSLESASGWVFSVLFVYFPYCGLTAGSAGASEMVYSGGLAMDVNS